MDLNLTLPKKVAAVVTTFNTGDAILPNLERIAKQVAFVIVVDDSGVPALNNALECAEIQNSVVLRNEKNLGIAASLNCGVAHAEKIGCDWVITLDDDTLVSESYVDDVMTFLHSGVEASIGLIACARVGSYDPQRVGNVYSLKRTLITSGCMFSLRVFREVGGFDEDLFIDLVDFDFCTKLRRLSLSIVQLNVAGMNHKVGNSQTMRLLCRKVVVYNHSPFRLYYQMRNIFLFSRKHFTFDPLLSIYLLLDVLRLPLKVLLFEQNKKARFFYLANGLKDGLLCRAGRLSRRFSVRN